MPIDQSRVYQLALCGEHIEMVYLGLATVVSSEIAKFRRGEQTAAQALLEIEQVCVRPEAAIAVEASQIRDELTRWRITHKKNEKDRLRKERQRRNRGIKPTRPVQRTQELLRAEREIEEGEIVLGGVDETTVQSISKGVNTADIDAYIASLGEESD